ncbi:TetR/AcrR family transcriptional regulator [Pseudonocardia xishanensis]|uniref:TetR/AcrR family transcriptional regulator n=1 Tax=Pseudonocardia xishanensis TaxID=630995 RepID=A0ABP8RWA2_9PSEU
MVTRAEMSIRTRASLISAAMDLLATRSYDDMSVGDVAAAAGVTKGAFYHHYVGKEELVFALQQHLLDEAIDASAVIVAERLPPAEELRALVRLHLTAVVEHRQALSVSLPERRSAGPEKWAVIRAKRNRIEAFVVECIERGRETGAFGPGDDPRLLAYGMLGMCYWSNVWFRRNGSWSIDEVADVLSRMVLDGVRAGA